MNDLPALRGAFLLGVLFTLGASPFAPAQTDYERDLRAALDAIEEECAGLLDRKKIDWKRVRRDFRKRVREVTSDDDHHVLLQELVARLQDGHARVRRKSGERPAALDRSKLVGPGMFWCETKKRCVIRNAWGAAKAAGLRPGMLVQTVDGVPVKKWIEAREAELTRLWSFSTPQHARFYTLQRGLAAPPGTRMKIVARTVDGKRKKATVTFGRDRAVPFGPAVPPDGLRWAGRNIAHGKTRGGFGYLHVRRSRKEVVQELDTALAAIGPVKGMVLDYRGNSGGGFDHAAFLGRFVPPGKRLAFESTIPSAGRTTFGGPVVVIVNATCVSAGETGSGQFKEEGRGYVIGESATAGMSSQKTTIDLPSGRFSLHVSVRSNKAWYNGDRGLEGVGVIPHEIVDLDAKDLAAGRDTLIIRAEALLKRFPRNEVPYRPRQFGWRPPKR